MKKQMMKRSGLWVGLCVSIFASNTLTGVEKSDLEKPLTKRSYALGSNYGKLLSGQSVEIEIDAFMSGLKDALAKESLLSETEIQAEMNLLTEELRAQRAQKRAEAIAQNKARGEAFLAENANQEAVIVLESGLQYKVLQKGEGAIPKASDKVRVHYRGTLIDGTIFDSSYEKDKPAEFGVSAVIRGWTEALQLMPVGSKWQLFIPSEMAYGERGMGNQIAPHSVLIFEVELLSIITPPLPKSLEKPKPVTSNIIKIPSAEELKKGAKPEVIKSDEVDDYLEREKAKETE